MLRSVLRAWPLAGLALVAACAEPAPVGPVAAPNFDHIGDPPPYNLDGHWELCKSGTDATFEVSPAGGTPFNVSLQAGECRDVYVVFITGPNAIITITELPQPGITQLDSIVLDSLIVDRPGPGRRVETGTNSVTASLHADIAIRTTFHNRPVEPPPPPPSGTGRMTGGGNQIIVGDVRISRGFTIHCDITLSNNVNVNWPDHHWHITKPITSAFCFDDPNIDQKPPTAPLDTFVGEAIGELNGQAGSTIKFTFIDAGEPGRGVDMAKIQIFDAGGTLVLDVPMSLLDNGNIQAHYDQPHGNKP